MKKYKIYSETTSYYYSTASITAWLPIFQNECYFKIIIDSFKYCQEHKGLYLLGYVIMPTHLHIITSNNDSTSLSEIMRDFKNYTSKEIRKQLEYDELFAFLNIFKKAAKNLPKQQYKVWQVDYHPIALTSEKWFNQKINYLHNNPVRKGFVELPECWKYSSARNWFNNDDSIIRINKELVR
ncbi:MAG: transposase [bacterium]